MAKIDFTQAIVDLEGKEIRWGDHRDTTVQLLALAAERGVLDAAQFTALREFIGAPENTPPMTLERVSVSALLQGSASKDETPEKKYEKYRLMSCIHGKKKPVTLKSEEVTTVKKSISESAFTPLIVGQCWDRLEGRGPCFLTPESEVDDAESQDQEKQEKKD